MLCKEGWVGVHLSGAPRRGSPSAGLLVDSASAGPATKSDMQRFVGLGGPRPSWRTITPRRTVPDGELDELTGRWLTGSLRHMPHVLVCASWSRRPCRLLDGAEAVGMKPLHLAVQLMWHRCPTVSAVVADHVETHFSTSVAALATLPAW